MNEYEQKQEARRERILARADRLRAEGQSRYKSGMDRLKAIPFGQPVHGLRDRNYREKARKSIIRGISIQNEAAKVEARAEAVGTGGVSSDDPDAIAKLTKELDERKAWQERMVKANKLVAKKDIDGLVALGLTEANAVSACEIPVWGNKFCAYEPYQLSNNSANIRRIEARIKSLEAAAGRQTKSQEFEGGITLVENAEANRVQLIFPGKPSEAVRTKLKKAGFRWSPREGAWQRHLNNAAVYWAKELVKEISKPALT